MVDFPVSINMPRPHSPAQMELVTSTLNDVVFAGRRWGKTQVGVYRLIYGATTNVGLYWWVGITWRSASMKRAWRLLKHYVRQIWKEIKKADPNFESKTMPVREADKELYLPNGSSIWLRSADNEESLAGESIKGVVFDEFSLAKKEVWSEYLEGTLLDSGGWCMFIGVPKGDNWASVLWRKAKNRKGWKAHQYKTADNPFIDKERLEDIRLNTDSRLYRQEYLAEINQNEGSVFNNIDGCVDATPYEPHEGVSYAMGIDWGKSEDYTVVTVIDNLGRVVYIDRFNQISWRDQVDRINSIYKSYNPAITVAESNSIGSVNIETMYDLGMEGIMPFNTSVKTKTSIINSLASALDKAIIRIPDDYNLISELSSYESEKLISGNIRYSAPIGMHDDMVMSLALAWHGYSYLQSFSNIRVLFG